MRKERKGVTPQNRSNLTMIVVFTIFMVVAFYLGSSYTAVAKDNELRELVAQEIKKQQAVDFEDKSPPLKQKKRKSKPTETPESTATPKPTLKPTETPESTATLKPTLKPTETPESTATLKPTLKPTETPDSTEKPVIVKLVRDAQVFGDIEDTKKPLRELKRGEKIKVIGYQYGWLKLTDTVQDEFVYYLDTDYLDRKNSFKPVYVSNQHGQKATVMKDGVELRTEPGFTSKSKKISVLNSGDEVVVHESVDMIYCEEKGYCRVTVADSKQEGYIYKDGLDWEMEFKIPEDEEITKEEGKNMTEIFEGKGIEVKVIQPTKMYEGTKSGSAVKKQLNPGDKITVQECREAETGYLMAVYRSGSETVKGFVDYLKTDYLDRKEIYSPVYQEKLNNVEATVNANSVNLRSKPGITPKSKVEGVAGKGLDLVLVSYVEMVRNERYGWYKVIVVDTGEEMYIYGKYVDVKENARAKKKLKSQEDKKQRVTTGSSITAKEERESDGNQETVSNKEKGESVATKENNHVAIATMYYFDNRKFLKYARGNAA